MVSVNKMSRGWWFHVVIAITIMGMISLSAWQFQRLQWKRGVIAAIESHWAAPIVPLAELENLPPGEWAWRRVQLPALTRPPTSLADSLLAVQNTGFGREPLSLSGNGHWLVVWPWQPNGAPQAVYGQPPFIALVKPVQPTAPFVPKNNLVTHEWRQMDAVLMQAFKPEIQTHYLQILTAEAATAAPILPNNNHLQYALTWAALAVVVAAMYAHLLWQRRKS